MESTKLGVADEDESRAGAWIGSSGSAATRRSLAHLAWRCATREHLNTLRDIRNGRLQATNSTTGATGLDIAHRKSDAHPES